MFRSRSRRHTARFRAAVAVAFSVAFLLAAADARAGLQLMNLSDAPTSARFTLTDRIWSATVGQPSVCLWEGDRYAALSITIDDNWGPDVDWWLQQQERTGLRFTWFLITDRVGTGSQWGSWSGYSNVLSLGNAVQSHTATHFSGTLSFAQEYVNSISAIETHLPGNGVTCLAYPGGTAMSNDPNRRTIAANYFIAARGTTGTPNKANQIDYLNTCSAGGGAKPDYVDSVLYGRSGISWLNNTQYLRSWLCTHYHGVPDANKAATAAELDYVASTTADLWVGLFDEVVRYGQERDTAKLGLLENTSQRVRFTLSDDMNDSLFDYPLTIKLRVSDDWSAVSATQGGAAVPVELVEHGGMTYALVNAVPDAGEVVVAPEPATLTLVAVGVLTLLRRRRGV